VSTVIRGADCVRRRRRDEGIRCTAWEPRCCTSFGRFGPVSEGLTGLFKAPTPLFFLEVKFVKRVLCLRAGFLGSEAWQINLEKKPSSEDELECFIESATPRVRCVDGGDEVPSVQPLSKKCRVYSLLYLWDLWRLTASARASLSVGPAYSPGQEADSEDALA
jgi:hypothetical protein